MAKIFTVQQNASGAEVYPSLQKAFDAVAAVAGQEDVLIQVKGEQFLDAPLTITK